MYNVCFHKTISLISEEELEELFNKFGTVSGVHLVIDKDTKRPKGFAFVNYTHPEFAARYIFVLKSLIRFLLLFFESL